MLKLPSSIDQKFAFAQVSRHWRDVALGSHLFWASFSGGASKADCCRLPLVLERSGSTTMLHIQLHFFVGAKRWPEDALKALVPYVTRIETLDVRFRVAVDVEALLNSNLEFPALQTLRLKGPAPRLLFTAPQLRTLHMERITLANWSTLLSPNLENIRLEDSTSEMLMAILKRCPRAWRIVLHSFDPWFENGSDNDFEVFASLPPASALRELELRLEDSDLVRVLKNAFSDVVLHTLTGCIINGHGEDNVELLANALLPGVGPLVVFKLIEMQTLELQDNDGRIRRLQCWNDDSAFEVQEVWNYLSIHYNLHKSVREIRIRPEYWDEYVEIFESYRPQLPDGITLGFEMDWNTDFPQLINSEGDSIQTTKIMQIPGLAKIEFCDSRNADLSLKTIIHILALIEPPTERKVEVCIGKKSTGSALVTLGNHWAICSHCISQG
ncbi:hypothetical protein B0H13DRAFT_903877 [Mycena leptocephala]|nr:hypothetical protein B0H13DRAFT_903877 [Mycena leptocephala]